MNVSKVYKGINELESTLEYCNELSNVSPAVLVDLYTRIVSLTSFLNELVAL